MRAPLPAALALAGLLTLSACGQKAEEKKSGPPAALITITQAKAQPLEVLERTLGTLEAVNDPKISAEFAGRITRIAVRSGEAVKKGQLLAELDPSDATQQHRADQGEIARLEALLAQQERLYKRQSELVQKSFISKNALEDAAAQRDALRGQLEAARGRAGLSGNNLKKTKVVAPFDGVVEDRIASVGDYIKLGDPMFRLVEGRIEVDETIDPERTAVPILLALGVMALVDLPSIFRARKNRNWALALLRRCAPAPLCCRRAIPR